MVKYKYINLKLYITFYLKTIVMLALSLTACEIFEDHSNVSLISYSLRDIYIRKILIFSKFQKVC